MANKSIINPAGAVVLAIEGSNGAGKTTLCQLLEQWPALLLITPGLDTKTTSIDINLTAKLRFLPAGFALKWALRF